jgi:DNA-binding transcriptional LysR family regulator
MDACNDVASSPRASGERRVDLILARVDESEIEDDLSADILFPDPILVVAGHRNKWLRRRRIQLSELINEPSILTPPDSVSFLVVAEAFRSKGLGMPRACVVSTSIHIINRLLPTGRYLTYIPESVLRFGSTSKKIRALPVDFPTQARPTAIVTFRNRTLNPAASLFIEAAHFVSKPMAVAKHALD